MGSMDVQVKKGEEHSVEIEGEENIISYIETYVNDGKLVIKYKDDVNIHTTEDVIVKVTADVLEDVEVLGSGDLTGEGKFVSNGAMDISITGSGNIKLDLDAPAVEAKITGSGDIDLSGNTKDVKCSTTGSGTINAVELKAENAGARTLGSGDISVFSSVKLDATINGSGSISYKGGGAVSSAVHGSGTIKHID